MPLSSGAGEKDIINHLRVSIPNVEFQRGTYLEDGHEPVVDGDGLFSPYVLVEFGGPYPVPRDNSLGGARWDTQRATIRLYCVAPFESVAGDVKDSAVEALVGFRPTDGGALSTNTGYAFTDADLGYNRYVRVVGFEYQFNLNPVVVP